MTPSDNAPTNHKHTVIRNEYTLINRADPCTAAEASSSCQDPPSWPAI